MTDGTPVTAPLCPICDCYSDHLIAVSLDPLVVVLDACLHIYDAPQPGRTYKPRRTT
jgi:hypothetical protein